MYVCISLKSNAILDVLVLVGNDSNGWSPIKLTKLFLTLSPPSSLHGLLITCLAWRDCLAQKVHLPLVGMLLDSSWSIKLHTHGWQCSQTHQIVLTGHHRHEEKDIVHPLIVSEPFLWTHDELLFRLSPAFIRFYRLWVLSVEATL